MDQNKKFVKARNWGHIEINWRSHEKMFEDNNKSASDKNNKSSSAQIKDFYDECET